MQILLCTQNHLFCGRISSKCFPFAHTQPKVHLDRGTQRCAEAALAGGVAILSWEHHLQPHLQNFQQLHSWLEDWGKERKWYQKFLRRPPKYGSFQHTAWVWKVTIPNTDQTRAETGNQRAAERNSPTCWVIPTIRRKQPKHRSCSPVYSTCPKRMQHHFLLPPPEKENKACRETCRFGDFLLTVSVNIPFESLKLLVLFFSHCFFTAKKKTDAAKTAAQAQIVNFLAWIQTNSLHCSSKHFWPLHLKRNTALVMPCPSAVTPRFTPTSLDSPFPPPAQDPCLVSAPTSEQPSPLWGMSCP